MTPTSPAESDTAGVPPWLADGDPVHLDEEFVAAALPTRAHPQPLPEPDWPATIAALRVGRERIDLDATDPALQELMASLWDRQPGTHTRTERLALLALARKASAKPAQRVGDLVMRAIAGDVGLIEATRMHVESLQYTVESDYQRGYSLRAAPANVWDDGGGDFAMLARIACLASDEDYTQVVAMVHAAFPQLPPTTRAAYALALADAPELSHQVITECAEGAPFGVSYLQFTATDPALIDRAHRSKKPFVSFEEAFINRLVISRGSAAVPLLAPHVGLRTSDWVPLVDNALARIGVPEAFQALATVLHVGNDAQLRAAADRFPAAAIAGLAHAIAGRAADNTEARLILTELIADRRDLATTVRPWCRGSAGVALDAIIGQLDGEDAVPDELPPVLAEPPWLRPRRNRPLVDGLEPLPLPPVETWEDGQRERWAASSLFSRPVETVYGVAQRMCWGAPPDGLVAALNAGDVAAGVAAFRAWTHTQPNTGGERVDGGLLCDDGAAVLDAVSPGFGLRLWNALAGTASYDVGVYQALGRHGADALPGLLELVRRHPVDHLQHAQVLGAVELAPLIARAYCRLKTLTEPAAVWLRTHPEHAAAGLIPAAIGAPGQARDDAETALRALASWSARDQILAIADRYGREDVTTAVTAMLDEDPIEVFPTKRPKLPDFWNPTAWRRPRLHNGKAVPLAAIDHLGTMLAFPTTDRIYPGIAQVRAACTPESLADFGWDMFTAWQYAGAPNKQSWAMTSLGSIGNDDTARALTPLLRAWPGLSQHNRAVVGLDVLAGIGSDVALMMLNGIATKVKFKALQERAREKIDQIAEDRGLTSVELEDRLAPDLGLDADGTLLLDFGPRTFRVGFDETLRPFVRDADGTYLKELPKPNRDDDADLAAAAATRWKTVKKDARTIAGQQPRRLELAMCTRRRWDISVFEQFLAGHPLIGHLVRRLVWATYTGTEPPRCFRVAEAGRYTDADDQPFTLPEDAVIGLPHRLELSSHDVATFGRLLTDYELRQPFPQLARDSYRLTDTERNATELLRWADLTISTGKILGLTDRGWQRGDVEKYGVIYDMLKRLPDGWTAVVRLSDGIATSIIDDVVPEQQISEVFVYRPGHLCALGEVDDVTISELIRDVEHLRD